ncbi:RING-H2 finger protein ATL63-like [Canna indica]|uniref:RING-H2 finger protein ATL63-like n=1 Tax=Canna indica TaxID=4628 RepID=A0AAQ3QI22_9LILI|nr:RING-H2 finger protein ATL63-like [Canna indica]
MTCYVATHPRLAGEYGSIMGISIIIFFVLLLHFYAWWLLRQQRRRPVIRRVFREPLHPPDRTTNIPQSHRRDKVAGEAGATTGVRAEVLAATAAASVVVVESEDVAAEVDQEEEKLRQQW